jgi:peptide/nickel transport system ATP-binding protein
LYRGQLCEVGDVSEAFAPPFHPYTATLLSAVPEPAPEVDLVAQLVPEVQRPETGSACPFASRCLWKIGDVCDEVDPPWREVGNHRIRCHLPLSDLQTVRDLRRACG